MDTPELRAEGRLGGDRPASPPPPPKDTRRKDRPKRRRFGGTLGFLFKTMLVLGVTGALAAGVAGFALYRNASSELPDYSWLADYQPPQMSRVYAADSRLMAELAQERRVFVPIEAIPQRVQQAFVAAEDQNFWTHHGVDPVAIARAVMVNVEQMGTGRRPIGASTITQQVAKNMLVGADRTLMRKVREAILAVRIENAMPKARILEIYLNEIFLGQQAYGVAAAAQTYFNKSLDELTLSEAAFLAALPKAPNNLNPVRFPEAARARRDYVLTRMVEDGFVTREEADRARAEPLTPRPTRRPDMIQVGGHFSEEVRRELIARFGAEQTTMGGLVVRTSLEPALQLEAERALRRGLMEFDRRRGGWRGPVAQINASATEWLPALQAVPRVPGMLPEWRLAVALEVRDREARMAWLERPEPRATPQPRTAMLAFEEVTWARPVRDGRLGPVPRRMQDVLNVGDVVLVEMQPAAVTTTAGPQGSPQGARQALRPERLALRQVPEVEGAVVALDPNNGRVLAMAGGWSFDKSWYNRATQAMRQPGSSFKPFVYLPALEQGVPPNQLLLDAPVEIMTPQGMWRPGNYGGGAPQGWVTMRSAMERSLNLVTIRLAQQVGMQAVSDTASRFGVIPNMPRFLAMSLGAGETTVLRQAAGYAGFVNGGRQITPTLIDTVQDRHGRVVWRTDLRRCGGCEGENFAAGPPQLTEERRQIADPIASFQMVSLLQGTVQRGTGTRAGEGLGRPVAGKTGTTDDYKDAWFVGFTPDLVVAVWVGYDEPRSMAVAGAPDADVTGGRLAAPIFRDVMAAALQGSPPIPFRAPPGTALVRLQLENGQTILEAFRPGTENSARPPSDPFGGASGGAAAAGLDRGLGGLY
ncbi:penicillin-binding protein 1A [Falsiroseomonas oryziterrae]|uniref:penicillin-binding protein 1A n=1 Tax=Falsiroseomonas oryziterrae TaxID=2911368 RepID=UPI001EFF75D2|nr:PBP1A family penicillin-binding protein [Roseomonas sp. NPKOSM-4]